MSELITAQRHAAKVISRMVQTIAANRIKNTWKSWMINKNSESERKEAMINKVNNLQGLSWKNGSAEQIQDLLESLEIKKFKSKVAFKDMNIIMNGTGVSSERMNHDDGITKSQTVFTYMVNTWYNTFVNKSEFFDNDSIKKMINDPVSSHWTEYLHDTINLLDKGSVILWGNNGGCKKIYNTDKNKITELLNYWKLYNIKKEIAEIKTTLTNIH